MPSPDARASYYRRLSQREWDTVAEVLRATEQLRTDAICFEVTAALAERLGWRQESGWFGRGPDRDGHYWNRLEDGTLVDPTYDQYEPGADPVRVIGPGDPDQADYRVG